MKRNKERKNTLQNFNKLRSAYYTAQQTRICCLRFSTALRISCSMSLVKLSSDGQQILSYTHVTEDKLRSFAGTLFVI